MTDWKEIIKAYKSKMYTSDCLLTDTALSKGPLEHVVSQGLKFEK